MKKLTTLACWLMLLFTGTAFAQAPSNDLCSAAIAVACGDTVNGTTIGATVDSMQFCGTTNTAPGVWYVFNGTGSNVVASLCGLTSYDSKLSVYEGTCGALVCVDGNDDACGLQSEVAFLSQPGTTYYILVHGFSANTGTFGLSISCPPPANDLCANAVAVNCGDTVAGTTVNSTLDSLATCVTTITTPGVWYSFTAAASGTFEANLCAGASYDTKISVFSGSCGALVCEDGNDDFCGLLSQVSWSGTAGNTYYILVHGFGGNTGVFNLAMNCPVPVAPANDTCGGAIPVACGDTVFGSTSFATLDPAAQAASCGTTVAAPGVWYSFVGNGGVLEANTCSGLTNYDTKMNLFTGDCDSLVCITGNDDFCGLQSSVSTVTDPGVTYYILVQGFNGSVGNFELAVNCPPPANDSCNNATAIFCGDTLSGTTVNATFDSLGTCGTSISAPGVWYQFDATANTTYEANLCSFFNYDTKMSVFTGACDSLVCITGNDDFCGLASGVSWPGTAGTTYYILVNGFNGGTGGFDIAMNCLPPPPPPPANDTCGGAIVVACGDTVYGSTEFALLDSGAQAAACGTPITAPGVWYEFTGTGGVLEADLCSDSTDYDTKLSIFTGDCDSLICVDGNDDFCGLRSGLSLITLPGETYYILVHGFSNNVGNFGLAINCPPPANDTCGGAVAIFCGDTLRGTTVGANLDSLGTCGTTITAPGVWYQFDATVNTNYEANLCAFSNYDTKMSVFTGDCDSLVCVGGNDDFCGLASGVTWSGTAGTTYYILVHGFNAGQGIFDIAMNCLPPPPPPPVNDTCTGAIAVVCGDTAYGTTISATVDTAAQAASCGTTITAPGVWYTFVGTGGVLDANLCSDSTNYDTKLSIFTGACDSLVCLDGNDDFCGLQSGLTVVTNPGETYFILVHGFSSNVGDFGLAINCPPPANDSCNAAFTLSCGDTLRGTTVGATVDSAALNASCGTSITAPGVWYEFTAINTGLHEVNTCTQTGFNYDTKLHVFAGDCDSLVCEGGNDDACGVQSAVTWNAVAGETYFVLVSGFGANTGLFDLTVVCPPPPPANDSCANAVVISCGQSVPGTTAGATLDSAAVSLACGTTVTAPGVWYEVTGTGGDLSVNTCSGLTTFDTKLTVFEGQCDSLICVDGNDDFCGLQSQVTWNSAAGVTYYVLVHGFSSSFGDFELNVVSGQQNQTCATATLVQAGDTVTGSTVCAQPDTALACGTSDGTGGGVWYEVDGTGNGLTASLCFGTNFDTKIRVYTGACDSLVCVVGNDDFCGLQSQVTWCSELGTTYFVLVHGFGANEGSFTLVMSDTLLADASVSYPATTFCAGDSAVLPTVIQAGGLFSGPGVNPNTGAFDPSVAGVGTHVVSYVVSSGTCSDSSATVMTVGQATVNLGFNQVGCASDSLCFDAGPGFVSYTWNNGMATQIACYTTSGPVIVEVVDSNGCVGSDTASVIVLPEPVAAFSVDDSLCPDIAFIDASTDATGYSWDFGNGTGSTGANPTVTYDSNAVYTVTLVTSNQCGNDTATASLTINCIVGIESGLAQHVSVYPNPTRSDFFVEISGLELEDLTLEVVGVTGQVLESRRLEAIGMVHREAFDLEGYAQGVYFVKVKSGGREVVHRIVKM